MTSLVCATCGYDVTTLEMATCPECGAAPLVRLGPGERARRFGRRVVRPLVILNFAVWLLMLGGVAFLGLTGRGGDGLWPVAIVFITIYHAPSLACSVGWLLKWHKSDRKWVHVTLAIAIGLLTLYVPLLALVG